MKMLFVFYVVLACSFSFIGIYVNQSNRSHCPNWWFAIALLMFTASPIFAKFCGIL